MAEVKVDEPCGRCDIGVYSELAAMNKKARTFGAMEEAERTEAMPRCKKHDRKCVGARHFHEMLIQIDAVSK